ncbi:MAG: hypothetical protein A2Y12_15780 [Planctomycetes bacterium GWF2_42_9]|nr:MAG: hypothetical protein A2Y12_15780 [Planctomycetes bacterium GWF2_42_9]HAL44373.1 hypothetical protein [Phycisphaerales bacterium]
MEKTRRKLGFTIVELLTVMAIIAILMGLLLPAMQAVRKLAKDTSQKAQFKAIENALEAYHTENGMYPDSTASSTNNEDTEGAHKLAEALVGRDLLGFDSKSSWDAKYDETRTDSDEIYATLDSGVDQATVEASLKRRQTVYLNVDKVGAFQLSQLFNNTGFVYPGNIKTDGSKDTARIAAPVLTDTYKVKKVSLPNGSTDMAGTPILYYKADTASKLFPDTMSSNGNSSDDLAYAATVADACSPGYMYNIYDNDELVKLHQMMKPTVAGIHRFNENYQETISFTTGAGAAVNNQAVKGVWLFYNTITNPKMTSQVRPHNSDTYILISAGNDGIYGTKDDIYNFEK